ncbi:PadR family transcriptional regulator [Microbacterium paludicola]|uniref:PadR family transcriptional regulator n=1 Tax=Microbacterium paludicola TaxID=300019 RepID=UPI0011A2974A|nr:PadR family transcriptional regulator [Microbacterium paludicola]
MSVRHSLLAILDQGSCYGYQLRAEFDRRTGGIRPLNVGQIYNTLERLERDGLVTRGDADAQGHVYWQITDAGSLEVARWLRSPVAHGLVPRDETAIKLAVAATLPGADATAAIRTQRAAALAHLQELRQATFPGGDGDSPEGLAWALIMDSMILSAEAEVHWLERAAQRLAAHPQHTVGIGLATERPRRGRPAKSA